MIAYPQRGSWSTLLLRWKKKGRLFHHHSLWAFTGQGKNNSDDGDLDSYFLLLALFCFYIKYQEGDSILIYLLGRLWSGLYVQSLSRGRQNVELKSWSWINMTPHFSFSLSRLPRERWKRKHTDYCNCRWLSDSRCLVDDRAHNYMKQTYKSVES